MLMRGYLAEAPRDSICKGSNYINEPNLLQEKQGISKIDGGFPALLVGLRIFKACVQLRSQPKRKNKPNKCWKLKDFEKSEPTARHFGGSLPESANSGSDGCRSIAIF